VKNEAKIPLFEEIEVENFDDGEDPCSKRSFFSAAISPSIVFRTSPSAPLSKILDLPLL